MQKRDIDVEPAEVGEAIHTAAERAARRAEDRQIYQLTGGRVATAEELARHLYTEYGGHAAWRNFSGGEMPEWRDVPLVIQEHWRAVAMAAVRVLSS